MSNEKQTSENQQGHAPLAGVSGSLRCWECDTKLKYHLGWHYCPNIHCLKHMVHVRKSEPPFAEIMRVIQQ